MVKTCELVFSFSLLATISTQLNKNYNEYWKDLLMQKSLLYVIFFSVVGQHYCVVIGGITFFLLLACLNMHLRASFPNAHVSLRWGCRTKANIQFDDNDD